MKRDAIMIVFIAMLLLIVAWMFAYTQGMRLKSEEVSQQVVFAENLKTKKSCKKHGYTWKAVGIAQFYTCIEEYSDGGKSCESSSDCQGNCIQKNIDGPATCELSSDRFGCGNTVENIAKWEGILCID